MSHTHLLTSLITSRQSAVITSQIQLRASPKAAKLYAVSGGGVLIIRQQHVSVAVDSDKELVRALTW